MWGEGQEEERRRRIKERQRLRAQEEEELLPQEQDRQEAQVARWRRTLGGEAAGGGDPVQAARVLNLNPEELGLDCWSVLLLLLLLSKGC